MTVQQKETTEDSLEEVPCDKTRKPESFLVQSSANFQFETHYEPKNVYK